MSIGEIWVNQRKIELSPIYQREAGVWSLEKKQLFIDSLLNGFDVPKLYFNELPLGQPYTDAVIDGKQRVSTIIDFIKGVFNLASDFIYSGESLELVDQPGQNYSFQDFTETAKETFKGVSLSVTKVYNSTDEDIEALFARLNNGEPLNSAESRNAIGGDMSVLIREISTRDFFTRKVRFSNNRYSHREVACKLLYMEWNRMKHGVTSCPELKKKYLDEFVKDNKIIDIKFKDQLTVEIDKRLYDLEKCFDDSSPELTKQSYPQFFFLWLREILSSYTHAQLFSLIKTFLPEFTLLRYENNEKPDEERDPTLVEFGRLTQQGTNNSGSMTERAKIMTRYFLNAYPEISFKDPRRAFSDEARYVIWVRAEKKCQFCSTSLPRLEDMDGDHMRRFVDGGATTLANARCLCVPCNRGQQE